MRVIRTIMNKENPDISPESDDKEQISSGADMVKMLQNSPDAPYEILTTFHASKPR